MRPSAQPTTSCLRQGLTLVEVMVALVLVAVGLLGIAGASALSLRAVAEHSAAQRATRQASLRLARLTADGCVGAVGGTATEARSGIRERWTVGAPIGGAILVDDSVEWTAGSRARQLVVQGAVLC